jgi:CxxC-x17-CxxC domain-containing protein
MAFQDKTLHCSDCGDCFILSAEEQSFFENKGYQEPKRCPLCLRARRSQRVDSHGHERPMVPTICAACGKRTEVPFQPREGRPVYCRECYNRIRLSGQ